MSDFERKDFFYHNQDSAIRDFFYQQNADNVPEVCGFAKKTWWSHRPYVAIRINYGGKGESIVGCCVWFETHYQLWIFKLEVWGSFYSKVVEGHKICNMEDLPREINVVDFETRKVTISRQYQTTRSFD